MQEKAAGDVKPERASFVKKQTIKEVHSPEVIEQDTGNGFVKQTMGKRVAPMPKPSAPEPAKPKAARPPESLAVKNLKDKKGKPIVTPSEEPLSTFVSVEDQMIAIDLKHVSGEDDNDI